MNRVFVLIIFVAFTGRNAYSQDNTIHGKLIAFYTAKHDLAHISFVEEANEWFPKVCKQNGFYYRSTNDWSLLNGDTLKNYDIVIFLDTRPDSLEQRKAFEEFMRTGGKWIGFHFAAFALTPSAYPQNWDWYHEEFLGSGEYTGNTWRPTSALLRVEDSNHDVTKNLPVTFTSAPNEWYKWRNDLRKNKAIQILLSIDSKSFPLGTGPKAHEIWHAGYYPVAWSNKKYRMVYFNMGHNDMDYDGGTNARLSTTFGNEEQNQLIVNSLFWLTGSNKKSRK